MKRLILAALAALPAIALAGAGEDIAGTWECRQPGVDYGNKPPILFIGAAQAKDAGQQVLVDVDGFARTVNGLADVTADRDGWWKVAPPEGQAFLVRPEAPGKSGRAAMQVRRGEGGADYRCYKVVPRRA